MFCKTLYCLQALNMPNRSKWATKEIAELLIFCNTNNIDPYGLEGSYAGAFGFGQFIPSSFNKLSIDYNKDGAKDPYNWEDVLGSIAYYLTENGYPKNDFNFSHKSKAWRGIRTYNRSEVTRKPKTAPALEMPNFKNIESVIASKPKDFK